MFYNQNKIEKLFALITVVHLQGSLLGILPTSGQRSYQEDLPQVGIPKTINQISFKTPSPKCRLFLKIDLADLAAGV